VVIIIFAVTKSHPTIANMTITRQKLRDIFFINALYLLGFILIGTVFLTLMLAFALIVENSERTKQLMDRSVKQQHSFFNSQGWINQPAYSEDQTEQYVHHTENPIRWEE